MSMYKSVAVIGSALMLTACMSTDPYTGQQKVSNTAKGAGIGAAAGALIGVATASDKDRKKGALTGAVAGAAIGGGVGFYMDKQEAQLRQRLEGTGVGVERVGDNIKLIMPGNITFATDSDQLRGDFYSVLDSVVLVVNEFDETVIAVKGFTDSTGSFEYNQSLSERRANSVASYLMSQSVAPGRLRVTGYGPRYPIADNATAAGRAQNRRVEIDLQPTGS